MCVQRRYKIEAELKLLVGDVIRDAGYYPAKWTKLPIKLREKDEAMGGCKPPGMDGGHPNKQQNRNRTAGKQPATRAYTASSHKSGR